MVVNSYQFTRKERAGKTRWAAILKWAFLWGLFLLVCASIAVVVYEVRTSKLQARGIARYATTLTYHLQAGQSDSIEYPQHGPFDTRLGYAQLPKLLERIEQRGMEVTQQTRFSPALLDYTSRGFYTPYPEKAKAGLNIVDCRGETVYKAIYPRKIYPSFESIPPLVVQSLLFIENRELLDPDKPYMNPAVNWGRFAKAIVHEAGKAIGMEYETLGGSTLATQQEKYRHSPAGRTTDQREKLRQMASASVRAYQQGPQTLIARKALVLSYVNSVPLSAAPGYGEVHGLGDGFWVWFGADIAYINRLLSLSDAGGDTLQAQGLALRQVISLMIAQRRPTYYLMPQGHAELSALTASYLRLMFRNGYISKELLDAGLAREVAFRDFGKDPAAAQIKTDKAALMVRNHLSGLLGTSIYDLDRLDLAATTTLQRDLQEQVSSYLDSLRNPVFASAAGILGEHLLSRDQVKDVRYSFTLYERTPNGNLVRVQTDNTEQPFDINEGSKLELGSTAKLRVFVTYLEVIAEIHHRYAGQPAQALRKAQSEPQDNLTRWVLSYLLSAKDKSLPATLSAAMERRYSASPNEVFFTGGGQHTFHNFQGLGNDQRPTVREALLKSINLPFIRLMRDLVRYSIYQNNNNVTRLLADNRDPRRREYLTRFADREGQVYLLRFWRKYKGKSPEERFKTLLEGMRRNPVRLGAVHRYLYPEADLASFSKFLRKRLPGEKLTNKRIAELYERYGPEAYNLPDQGYITRVHPLELWLLRYMLQQPEAKWTDVAEDSREERQEVYEWLFRTRFKNARDSRIRTMLELEAFADIQRRWKKLGYPFNYLVPSYATALGSSGDRPAALAELMGIIMNNGVRQPTRRIDKLHFAAHTPYETVLQWAPAAGEQVMAPEVAAAVRKTLTEVVGAGTARRLQGGFTNPEGEPLPMGGKTGTGDNRFITLNIRGHRLASRPVNRTATFVFFLGESHFGTLTAFVPGREAADFSFTSSLPIQVLRSMAPILQPYLEPGSTTKCGVVPDSLQAVQQQVAVNKK